jgi:hypothetical protein
MDKATRDRYRVHQQEVEDEIHKLSAELKRLGTVMAQFGTEVMNSPEKVLFANAPLGLGEIPPELVGAPTFNWDEVPDRVAVARQIKALRRAMARRALIRRQLLERP